jgi:hypothetical protein
MDREWRIFASFNGSSVTQRRQPLNVAHPHKSMISPAALSLQPIKIVQKCRIINKYIYSLVLASTLSLSLPHRPWPGVTVADTVSPLVALPSFNILI